MSEEKQKKKQRTRGYFLYFEGELDELSEEIKRRIRIIDKEITERVDMIRKKIKRVSELMDEIIEELSTWR